MVRPVDLPIATGVYPDMTEHGWDQDAWPDLDERVRAADIVIIGSPIWLGQHSSVCATVIERLYGSSAATNDHGQFAYYGKVGGCVITSNEDGAKHCAMDIPYSLQHLGFTIRHRRMRRGSARLVLDRAISTKARADRTTTSPSAASPS